MTQSLTTIGPLTAFNIEQSIVGMVQYLDVSVCTVINCFMESLLIRQETWSCIFLKEITTFGTQKLQVTKEK